MPAVTDPQKKNNPDGGMRKVADLPGLVNCITSCRHSGVRQLQQGGYSTASDAGVADLSGDAGARLFHCLVQVLHLYIAEISASQGSEGNRVLVFGFRVSGFRFRVLGFRFQVSCLGLMPPPQRASPP